MTPTPSKQPCPPATRRRRAPKDHRDEPAAWNDTGTWWSILLTAWLGGLILNLMPCVFPVLSLKLLGFVDDDAAARRTLRSAFVASAAGVIVSFLVLATALVALKAAGGTLGWGIQFQHPVFLALMAAVITLFAANLLGLFELSLPPALMNALARHGGGSSVPSHFAGGFVATLLATPCSAPFVGTAVGFALSQGSFEIYAVLGVLGIGMATPYLTDRLHSKSGGGAAAARPLDALGQARAGRAAAGDLGMARHSDRRDRGFRSRIARGGRAGLRPGRAVVAGHRVPRRGAIIAVSCLVIALRASASLPRSSLAGVTETKRPASGGARSANSTRWCDPAAQSSSTSPPTGASPARSTRRWSSKTRPSRGGSRATSFRCAADWTRPDPRIAAYSEIVRALRAAVQCRVRSRRTRRNRLARVADDRCRAFGIRPIIGPQKFQHRTEVRSTMTTRRSYFARTIAFLVAAAWGVNQPACASSMPNPKTNRATRRCAEPRQACGAIPKSRCLGIPTGM